MLGPPVQTFLIGGLHRNAGIKENPKIVDQLPWGIAEGLTVKHQGTICIPNEMIKLYRRQFILISILEFTKFDRNAGILVNHQNIQTILKITKEITFMVNDEKLMVDSIVDWDSNQGSWGFIYICKG